MPFELTSHCYTPPAKKINGIDTCKNHFVRPSVSLCKKVPNSFEHCFWREAVSWFCPNSRLHYTVYMVKTLEVFILYSNTYDPRMCHEIDPGSVMQVQVHNLKKCLIPVWVISCNWKWLKANIYQKDCLWSINASRCYFWSFLQIKCH